MRRSRARRKIINIKQSRVWNNNGSSSSIPSYESFTNPTSRGFPSKEVTTLGNNQMAVSFTCQEKLAMDTKHIQEFTSSKPLLQAEHGNNNEELIKDMEIKTDSCNHLWSNAIDCLENTQSNSHSLNCGHPDFQSFQHVKPIIRILHEDLQILEERESKNNLNELQKEDNLNLHVNGENSESKDEHTRSKLPKHDLPTQSCFPHPVNLNWMSNANVCRKCSGTTFSTTNQAASICNTCVEGTKFIAPSCSFQRGVPRAVHYYVEPASLNEIKCFPCRTKVPACYQRMNLEGSTVYAIQAMKQPSVDLQGRNLVQPSQRHTCGTTHYISGNDHVLVCPAPWIHKGQVFPGVPAMCVDQQKYGVNWAPPEKKSQSISNKEDLICKMPDPVLPPVYHTPNFSTNLDMDTQRQLEEQIAHEILMLSQKLANLQARYGAKHLVHDNTKLAIMSCPQTPLLLDNPTTYKDIKCNNSSTSSMNEDTHQQRPATSSSSRSTTHRQLDLRCQVKERKLKGKYTKSNATKSPPITSNRRIDLETTVDKHHSNYRGSFGLGNSTKRGVAATLAQQWGEVPKETMRVEKSSNNKFKNFTQKERELVDECSYSDDMKEHMKTGGANVQGYPDGNKRFDWVKTLRFGGVSVRENQGCAHFASQVDSKPSSPQIEFADVDAETWLRDSNEHEAIPTSMSKYVQACGINSPKDSIDICSIIVDNFGFRPKKRPNSSIERLECKKAESLEELGGLNSRLAHHLVKAGLRRAPSFWRVPSIRPVSNATSKLKKKAFGSQSPKKDGGKRLCQRTLFDPTSNNHEVASIIKNKENVSQPCELTEEPHDQATKCTMGGDYEAEYETFVENTSNVGLQNDTLDFEEYTSVVNKESLTSQKDGQIKRRSPLSCQEKAKLSEVPVVSLTKQPPHQATKKMFIRCIELVVATKKKNQILSKLNGRKDSGYNSHRKIVDCLEMPSIGMESDRIHVIGGVVCQDNTQWTKEQNIGKPKQHSKSSSTMALIEIQGIKQIVFHDSKGEIGDSKGHLEHVFKILDNQSKLNMSNEQIFSYKSNQHHQISRIYGSL